MNNFLYRKIKAEGRSGAIQIRVWRSRTSDGNNQIGIEFGNQRMELERPAAKRA